MPKTAALRDRGFTLIEVVIAMAILGVGLVVIIELFSGGLRLERTSEEVSQAVNYARMKMEELSLQEKIEEGIQSGQFNKIFRWETECKKVDVLPPEKVQDITLPIELFQVRVNVFWKSGSKERSTGIETYRAIKRQELPG
jgi:general secretion pathway protein I